MGDPRVLGRAPPRGFGSGFADIPERDRPVATGRGRNDAPAPVRLGAHIQDLGDRWFEPGEWAGERGGGRSLEGLVVSPGPDIAAGELAYAAIGPAGALSDWVAAGEFCGSRGQDRPLHGVRFRLQGRAAESWELVCAATFVDGSAFGPIGGAELSCRSAQLAPLEAIRLELRANPQPRAAAADSAVLAVPDLEGESYLALLERLHQVLRPRNYLEIGTFSGDSLALSQTASVAVDPRFAIGRDVIGGKPFCLFYQMPSDRFFADFAPQAMFGGPIELAFLDGMHWFEFLLRDFMNVEANARPNSVICLHDCIPTDVYMTAREETDPIKTRSRHPLWWTGDVWKVPVILQKYRPDLQLHAFDAAPTGVVAITGLDPGSTVLRDRYFSLVEEFRDQDLATYGITRYLASLRIVPTGRLQKPADIAKYFWL